MIESCDQPHQIVPDDDCLELNFDDDCLELELFQENYSSFLIIHAICVIFQIISKEAWYLLPKDDWKSVIF